MDTTFSYVEKLSDKERQELFKNLVVEHTSRQTEIG